MNGGGPGAEYEITGHKWFFSIPMCDAFLVLAQAEGGISCFLFPRWTPDGERNRFRLVRLKDKLGNRSNASSEVEFAGAWARLVGEERERGRADDHRDGQPHTTRLRGGQRGRHARGARPGAPPHRAPLGLRRVLAEQPLMQNVLADLAIESEAATIAALRLARSYDEALAGDEQAEAFKRIANPVLKYWVCKRTPPHAVECLECLGGNGYVEESGMPRLVRESPLNSIWEGAGNVQCLDLLRTMARSPRSLDAFFAEVGEAAGAEPPSTRPPAGCATSWRAWLRSRRAPAAWSSGWPWCCRGRSWFATAMRRSPTRSAHRGLARTGAAPSGRCRRAATSRESSRATMRRSEAQPPSVRRALISRSRSASRPSHSPPTRAIHSAAAVSGAGSRL